MDYTTKINQLKAAIDKAKTARATAQANKKNAEERIAEIDAEVKRMGYDPEQLDSVIQKLDEEIKTGIAEVEAMIPEEYRG